jgi:curved DNA-binding protein CbpA
LGAALVACCSANAGPATEHVALRLIASGADLTVRQDGTERTALHCAAASRSAGILEAILGRIDNGDVAGHADISTDSGESARHGAARAAEVRLRALDAVDREGHTALHIAARFSRHRNVEMVRRLLRSGAAAGARSKTGQTALELATDESNVTCMWGRLRTRATPRSILEAPQQRFWNCSRRGTLLYRARRFAAALEQFGRALELAEAGAPQRSKSGLADPAEDARPAAGAGGASKLSVADQDRARLHYNCGRAALQCAPARVVESLRHAEAALELSGDAGYSGALAMRGECHAQLLDFGRAARDFATLLERHPSGDEGVRAERRAALRRARACRDASHYAVLGVDWSATRKEIQRAFRRESVRWHPDKARQHARRSCQAERSPNSAESKSGGAEMSGEGGDRARGNPALLDGGAGALTPGDSDTAAARATIHFKRINEARQVLCNASDRVMYDVERRSEKRRRSSGGGGEGRQGRRSRRGSWSGGWYGSGSESGSDSEMGSDGFSGPDEGFRTSGKGVRRQWPWTHVKTAAEKEKENMQAKLRAEAEAQAKRAHAERERERLMEKERESFREWQRQEAERRHRAARDAYQDARAPQRCTRTGFEKSRGPVPRGSDTESIDTEESDNSSSSSRSSRSSFSDAEESDASGDHRHGEIGMEGANLGPEAQASSDSDSSYARRGQDETKAERAQRYMAEMKGSAERKAEEAKPKEKPIKKTKTKIGGFGGLFANAFRRKKKKGGGLFGAATKKNSTASGRKQPKRPSMGQNVADARGSLPTHNDSNTPGISKEAPLPSGPNPASVGSQSFIPGASAESVHFNAPSDAAQKLSPDGPSGPRQGETGEDESWGVGVIPGSEADSADSRVDATSELFCQTSEGAACAAATTALESEGEIERLMAELAEIESQKAKLSHLTGSLEGVGEDVAVMLRELQVLREQQAHQMARQAELRKDSVFSGRDLGFKSERVAAIELSDLPDGQREVSLGRGENEAEERDLYGSASPRSSTSGDSGSTGGLESLLRETDATAADLEREMDLLMAEHSKSARESAADDLNRNGSCAQLDGGSVVGSIESDECAEEDEDEELDSSDGNDVKVPLAATATSASLDSSSSSCPPTDWVEVQSPSRRRSGVAADKTAHAKKPEGNEVNAFRKGSPAEHLEMEMEMKESVSQDI